MLLSETLTPEGLLPEGFNAPSYGLVYGQDVYDLIMSIQDSMPDLRHRIAPVATSDGRWLTCADVLTEATRGIMQPIFNQIPPETAALVSIMPWENATALLPEPEPLEIGGG